MSDTFLITTPIYYVDDCPHLGHAYTTIVADVVHRFHHMYNEKTLMLTGTDEHGDKIAQAAQKQQLSCRKYVDQISQQYKTLCSELNISPHRFLRTTDAAHIAVVEKLLQKLYDSGDIYFSDYEGRYCVACERFYTEKELKKDKCPVHGKDLVSIKEANYFFRLSKYQAWLVDYLKAHKDIIRPEWFHKEVLSFLKDPLEDLCISRPKTRLQWGITLPFDSNYVTYVWFDALINYISALGYPNGKAFKTFWSNSEHIIAKDILKPHSIYWPIMLKAAGIPIFQRLNVHGYWNIGRKKISKSFGNVKDPLQLKDIYGLDSLRYYLIKNMVFGKDARFDEKAFIDQINSDLANDLGNLLSRVVTMVHKYLKGIVPVVDPDDEKEFALNLKTETNATISAYEYAMLNYAFPKAIKSIWAFIYQMNRYIDISAPWELAKRKRTKQQLEVVLYNLLEGLRIVSAMIYPIMPDTAKLIQKHLGMDPNEPFYLFENLKKEGMLKSGTKIPKTVSLFPRIDPENLPVTTSKEEASVVLPGITKPDVDGQAMDKLDLRAATIIEAQRIPRAKTMMKLTVDIGEKRTMVAPIAASYNPEDVIGKQVVVVANLKPVKKAGFVTQGCLLLVEDGKEAVLTTIEKKVKPGTSIK